MLRARLLTPLVLLCALTLGLSACGTATAGSQGAEGDRASSASVGSTPDLDFTGTTVDGASFDGSDLAGHPAVLWFWAPWCPTCRGQVPDVQAAAEKYADRVRFVGVGGLEDDRSSIADFAAGVGSGVPELSDPDGTVWKHFGVTEQSTYVVLDADGEVTARGVLDGAGLDRAVAAVAG